MAHKRVHIVELLFATPLAIHHQMLRAFYTDLGRGVLTLSRKRVVYTKQPGLHGATWMFQIREACTEDVTSAKREEEQMPILQPVLS
jgi:hypothetical protein